jgi:hypothetical protein
MKPSTLAKLRAELQRLSKRGNAQAQKLVQRMRDLYPQFREHKP